MKTLWSLCFILGITCSLHAQNNPQESALKSSLPSSNDNAIREKLVALALQNSDKKISDLQVKAAKDHIGLAKAEWINTIFASSYWNEFSINPPAKDQFNFYYPKYNFGISIPLGIFITVPKHVKIAKAEYHIAQEQQKLKVLNIRSQVLTKYEDYLMYQKQLTIQSMLTDNEYNTLVQAKTKFSSGEIDVNEYNMEMEKYNNQLSKKISLEHNLAIAKLALEEIIGKKLEEVLH